MCSFFENTKFNDIPAISMSQYNQRKGKFYQNNGSHSNANKVGKSSLKYLNFLIFFFLNMFKKDLETFRDGF